MQVLRKEEGLAIEDRIDLTWQSESADVTTIFERFDEYIRSEILALTLTPGEAAEGKAIQLAGQEVKVVINRAGS